VTKDRQAKQAARRRKAATGEPYVRARRNTQIPHALPTREELAFDALQNLFRQVEGEMLNDAGEYLSVQVQHVPANLIDAAIHRVRAAMWSVVVQVAEEFDGDTEAFNGTCQVEVLLEGLMPNAAVSQAAQQGLISILDPNVDGNQTSVLVHLTFEGEAQFGGILMLGSESVEDIQLDGPVELLPR
jgi:hypothetical protein